MNRSWVASVPHSAEDWRYSWIFFLKKLCISWFCIMNSLWLKKITPPTPINMLLWILSVWVPTFVCLFVWIIIMLGFMRPLQYWTTDIIDESYVFHWVIQTLIHIYLFSVICGWLFFIPHGNILIHKQGK